MVCRMFTPEQAEDPACFWDFQEAAARSFDAHCEDPSESWVPPNLTALVMAARNTDLRRFFPFTAHENLCFGLRSLYHVGDKPIAPVFISRDRENGYTVWACHPYEGRRNAEARKLDTTDPKQADAETERLLAEWP